MTVATTTLGTGLSNDQVISIAPEATVAEAASRMREHGIASLLVVDAAGAVRGIVTERDLVQRSTACSSHPDRQTVDEVMTHQVVTVTPGTSLREVGELMAARGVRHVPVIDGGRPVGMISGRDMLTRQLGLTESMKAAAEQAARLSKGLKSLELKEIVEILTREVPQIFQARRWALWYADGETLAARSPVVRQKGCPRPMEALENQARRGTGPSGRTGPCRPVPAECQDAESGSSRMLVPLDGAGRHGGASSARPGSFLCMCGLDLPATDWEEVLSYKGELVRDIVNANLTNAQLYRAARRDALTDLRTRQALEEELAEEHARSLRYNRPFCVGMLDMDGFKVINDSYGHLAGDEVLVKLADILRANVRSYDLVARYGGDEFVVLMPETALDGAVTTVERLRRRVEAELAAPDGRQVTVSCGVAEWSRQKDTGPTDVLRRADAALYRAKQAGRNCVRTAPSDGIAG